MKNYTALNGWLIKIFSKNIAGRIEKTTAPLNRLNKTIMQQRNIFTTQNAATKQRSKLLMRTSFCLVFVSSEIRSVLTVLLYHKVVI